MSDDDQVDILFAINSLAVGGAERVAVTLANGFAARGYRVAILSIKTGGELVEQVSEQVELHTLDNCRIRYALGPMRRKIQELRPNTIVSFLLNVNFLSILAARLAGTGTAVIATEHNQFNLFKTWSWSVRSSVPAAPFIYALSNRVVCCSPAIRDEWAARAGLPAKKVTTILNPLITEKIARSAAQDSGHKWFDDHSIPLIVAAGRLSVEKDFSTLLKAFADLRRCQRARLIILGDGEKRGELSALADTLRIAQDVDMPGYTENPFCMYSRADVVALSSITEGYPSVIIEALASGTDVVMTSCLSHSDQIAMDQWVHGSVPVGDHEQLADALLNALNNRTDPTVLKNRVGHLSDHAAIDQFEALIFNKVTPATRPLTRRAA